MSDSHRPEAALRKQVVDTLQRMEALGLNRGSTGNVSHRLGPGMIITPTGFGAEQLRAQDLVWLGDDGALRGDWQPSSEWQFHRALYRARADLQAVVHTHSVHATALACLDRGLPAFHYMVAVAGGHEVRCAPYHTFGSAALSDAVVEAMGERRACLLAHHGLVAAAETLAQALKVAVEIEALCEVYLKALAVGEPTILGTAQMDEVVAKFRSYGRTARA